MWLRFRLFRSGQPLYRVERVQAQYFGKADSKSAYEYGNTASFKSVGKYELFDVGRKHMVTFLRTCPAVLHRKESERRMER